MRPKRNLTERIKCMNSEAVYQNSKKYRSKQKSVKWMIKYKWNSVKYIEIYWRKTFSRRNAKKNVNHKIIVYDGSSFEIVLRIIVMPVNSFVVQKDPAKYSPKLVVVTTWRVIDVLIVTSFEIRSKTEKNWSF